MVDDHLSAMFQSEVSLAYMGGALGENFLSELRSSSECKIVRENECLKCIARPKLGTIMQQNEVGCAASGDVSQPTPGSSSGLVHWNELLPWQKDNEFILTNYRKASFSFARSLKSVQRLHNESSKASLDALDERNINRADSKHMVSWARNLVLRILPDMATVDSSKLVRQGGHGRLLCFGCSVLYSFFNVRITFTGPDHIRC